MSTKSARHDSTDSDSSIASYLAEHPRMMGVLFTALLLLAQAGSVAAGNNATLAGP